MKQVYKYRDIELGEVHFDALREISSIGMGHAATALNQMTGKTIGLSIPEVFLLPPSEVSGFINRHDGEVAGILLEINGDFSGSILVVFPKKSAIALSALLTGADPDMESQLSDMHASALSEVGNIIASSFLGALERLIHKVLIPSVPGIYLDITSKVIENILGPVHQNNDLTLVVKTAFSEKEERIAGNFYLIPDPESLKIVIEAVKVLARPPRRRVGQDETDTRHE